MYGDIKNRNYTYCRHSFNINGKTEKKEQYDKALDYIKKAKQEFGVGKFRVGFKSLEKAAQADSGLIIPVLLDMKYRLQLVKKNYKPTDLFTKYAKIVTGSINTIISYGKQIQWNKIIYRSDQDGPLIEKAKQCYYEAVALNAKIPVYNKELSKREEIINQYKKELLKRQDIIEDLLAQIKVMQQTSKEKNLKLLQENEWLKSKNNEKQRIIEFIAKKNMELRQLGSKKQKKESKKKIKKHKEKRNSLNFFKELGDVLTKGPSHFQFAKLVYGNSLKKQNQVSPGLNKTF
ncbi:MAG: hypothetical protein PVI75_00085 [Gammaproteobacteria bacterium]|jgi:hypothetical protein